MHPDGTLDWTPPAGNWVVLRMGDSLLGITNHPASPEATGLEVDKLNKGYVKEYMGTYLDNYRSAVGPLMGKRGLKYVITDSWEAGAQNWTDDPPKRIATSRAPPPSNLRKLTISTNWIRIFLFSASLRQFISGVITIVLLLMKKLTAYDPGHNCLPVVANLLRLMA
jgi:hypothetical protein